VFDAESDHALVIEHPAASEVEAARRASGLWRETVGAFQLGIPVSTKDELLLHHLRLLSVMVWRVSKLSRKSRWHAAFTHYVELIADKVRALGGDPFAVPATPDGWIPQLSGKDGSPTGGGGGGNGQCRRGRRR
jgi:hypothetical protein